MEFKIICFGHDNVGKSSFMNRICVGHIEEPISRKYQRRTVFNNGKNFIEFLPISNDNDYIALVDLAIKNSSGCFIIFSLTSKPSFDGVVNYFNLFTQQKENCPVILIGSKKDLNKEIQVSQNEIDELISLLKIPYFEITISNVSNDYENPYNYLQKQLMMQHNIKDENSKKDCVIM